MGIKRPGHHIARTTKGHPRRQARRDRAAERASIHVNGPECGPNCAQKAQNLRDYPDWEMP